MFKVSGTQIGYSIFKHCANAVHSPPLLCLSCNCLDGVTHHRIKAGTQTPQNKQLVNERGGSVQSLEETVVSDSETKLNFPVIRIYERLRGILER